MKKITGGALALFVSGTLLAGALGTGGAVAAGMIGSGDIRDDSVRSVDVRNETLRLRDMRPGVQDKINSQPAQGPEGPQGPAGEDGTANPSAAGAGYDTTWPADGQVHETVETCAEGEYVTGGGFSTFGGAGLSPTKDLGGNNQDIVVTVSAPYVASDQAYEPISDTDSRFYADRWVVRGYNNGTEPQVVRAWALCAPLPN